MPEGGKTCLSGGITLSELWPTFSGAGPAASAAIAAIATRYYRPVLAPRVLPNLYLPQPGGCEDISHWLCLRMPDFQGYEPVGREEAGAR